AGDLLKGRVRDERVGGVGRGGLGGVEVDAAAAAAALESMAAADTLDQDAPHGLGRRGEEEPAVVPGAGRDRRRPGAESPRGLEPWAGASCRTSPARAS